MLLNWIKTVTLTLKSKKKKMHFGMLPRQSKALDPDDLLSQKTSKKFKLYL